MIQDAFVALDFETANGKRTSICSVGMVKRNISYSCESASYFSQQNIKVHGIQPEDVENARTFDYVFPYMMQFIADLPVVAHNAAFDMNVLHQSIQNIGLPTPNLTYFCSYQLAKRTVVSYRYGLKHMMEFYQLDFHGHHDALNDAKACAMITFRLLKNYENLTYVTNIYGKNLKDKG
ncbi:exonuclease domain-containing protein [Staphylococcus aureus]